MAVAAQGQLGGAVHHRPWDRQEQDHGQGLWGERSGEQMYQRREVQRGRPPAQQEDRVQDRETIEKKV